MTNVPLFPLNSVFYPGALLPLKIFERRYLDMVTECMKKEHGFVVCLIKEGHEVGAPAQIRDIGTYGEIVDWDQQADGLLQITACGKQRCRVLENRIRENGLMEGDITWIDEPDHESIPEARSVLVDILQRLIKGYYPQYQSAREEYEDAGWVSFRLAEYLPLDPGHKQELLEIDDSLRRLDYLQNLMQSRDTFERGAKT